MLTYTEVQTTDHFRVQLYVRVICFYRIHKAVEGGVVQSALILIVISQRVSSSNLSRTICKCETLEMVVLI